jgi:zinc protease
MLNAVRCSLALLALLWTGAAALALEIKEVTSPLGLKAWLVEEPAVPLIAMSFSFAPGAAADPPGKEGLSHFLTGMLDEGAGDLDSAAFQSRRDELSFKMSFDSDLDNFEGNFQTLSKNRKDSFAMLKLALTTPRFDADPLERVRSQLLVGAQQNLEDPEKIVSRAFMTQAFGAHPYAREREGSPATLTAVTAEDLRLHHKRLFTRKSLTVAVVGDISADELGPLLDEIFGALPNAEPPVAVQRTEVKGGPRVDIVDRDIPQSIIMFGHDSILRNDPRFFGAYVASFILGGSGFNSRLTTEIREKRGLTYGIGAGLYPLDQAGLMLGQVGTANEKASETLGLVRSVMAEFATKGPTAAELEAAKTYLTGSYALRFDSNTKIASQLLGIQQEKLGLDYIQKRNSYIEALTLDEVKAEAKRIFRPEELIVTIVGRPAGVAATGG